MIQLTALVVVYDRGTSTHLVQRPRRRRLPGLAADEEERWWFLSIAQQVGQALVRAHQEESLLLQTTARMLSVSRVHLNITLEARLIAGFLMPMSPVRTYLSCVRYVAFKFVFVDFLYYTLR